MTGFTRPKAHSIMEFGDSCGSDFVTSGRSGGTKGPLLAAKGPTERSDKAKLPESLQKLVQFVAVSSTEAQLGTVLEDNRVLAVEHRLEFANRIDIDDR